MTLLKAKRTVWTWWLLGWAFSLLGFVGYMLFLFKMLYLFFAVSRSGFSMTSGGIGIGRYKEEFLTNYGYLFTVLDYVPPPDNSRLFSSETGLYVVLFFCFIMIGGQMRKSASHLAGRIRRFEEDYERDHVWSRERGYVGTTRDILAVEIQLQSRDQWYKRPPGILAMMITGGVIVQLIRMWIER